MAPLLWQVQVRKQEGEEVTPFHNPGTQTGRRVGKKANHTSLPHVVGPSESSTLSTCSRSPPLTLGSSLKVISTKPFPSLDQRQLRQLVKVGRPALFSEKSADAVFDRLYVVFQEARAEQLSTYSKDPIGGLELAAEGVKWGRV